MIQRSLLLSAFVVLSSIIGGAPRSLAAADDPASFVNDLGTRALAAMRNGDTAAVQGRFPPPRLSARYRISQETFAGTRANGRGAPKIGIGGHLAVPPLPHHRAYGSVPRRFDWVKLGQRHGVGETE